jgi:hypothetical protein
VTTTTHTPGPWHYKMKTLHNTSSSPVAKILDASENVPSIATCHDAKGTCEANARLIAAAPELLAALQALVNDKGLFTKADWWGKVLAAIDKANGNVYRDYISHDPAGGTS